MTDTTYTEYRVTWETSRVNPKYVRGLRGSHREIITTHTSEIFNTLEAAKEFRATVTGEFVKISHRRPGLKNFQTLLFSN